MGQDDRSIGRGTAWVGIASGLSGVLDVITTVTVLWLWLSPADLGLATLAGAMLPVLERIAQLGMPAAMVRQADGDRRALSTMLWIAVAGSLVVFAGVALLGPTIAGAFGQPVLASLLIGYAIKLVLQGAHAVPEALMRRALRFDALTRVRIAASFADAAAKLVVAYLGAHGEPALRPWCFVIGPMVNGVVTSIGLQLYQPWWPAWIFDRAIARRALRYGTQVSGGELLYYVYTNADYLVIGRVWGEAAVGAYRLAYELVLDVVRLISLVTAEVAFPAFARLLADARQAGALLVRFTRQNAIALMPVVVFLAVSADDLLAVLYPPLPPTAALAARILCVVGGLRMISFVLPAMLAGLGHASDALVYHALAALLLPAAFAVSATVWSSADFIVVAWAWAAVYPLVFLVLLGRSLARAHVTLRAYLGSLGGIALCGLVTAVVATAAHLVLPLPPLLRLLSVAGLIVVTYGLLLARIEHVTPRSVLRAMR